MKLQCALLASLLAFPFSIAHSADLKPAAWVPLPAVGSSPETGFQYGGYVMRIFPQVEAETPQNRLELLLQGTTKGQFQAYIWPNAYFEKGNWQVKGTLGGMYWPSDYFGQAHTRSDTGDKYSDTAIESAITLNYNTQSSVGFGVSLFAEYHNIEDIDEPENMSLFDESVIGLDGGLYSGAGLNASSDTRNNLDWPSQGRLISASWDYFTPVLGSDLEFHLLQLSATQYISAGADVIAASSQLAVASDQTPFTHLPRPSGDSTLRGANGNQWIGQRSLGVQAEYRKPLSPRWAIVAFADTFSVASTLSDLFQSDSHFSTGLGIRFATTPDRFNIRLDVGWVDAESVNFALTVGEAF